MKKLFTVCLFTTLILLEQCSGMLNRAKQRLGSFMRSGLKKDQKTLQRTSRFRSQHSSQHPKFLPYVGLSALALAASGGLHHPSDMDISTRKSLAKRREMLLQKYPDISKILSFLCDNNYQSLNDLDIEWYLLNYNEAAVYKRVSQDINNFLLLAYKKFKLEHIPGLLEEFLKVAAPIFKKYNQLDAAIRLGDLGTEIVQNLLEQGVNPNGYSVDYEQNILALIQEITNVSVFTKTCGEVAQLSDINAIREKERLSYLAQKLRDAGFQYKSPLQVAKEMNNGEAIALLLKFGASTPHKA